MPSRRDILLIEPNDWHFALVRESFFDANLTFNIRRVRTLVEAMRQIKNSRPHLILLEKEDQSDLLTMLEQVYKKVPQTPIIILTSFGDESLGVQAIQRGAEDFLIKTRANLGRLPNIVSKTIGKSRKKNVTAPPTKFLGLQSLSMNIKNLMVLLNEREFDFLLGKKQRLILEQEIRNLKKMVRNLVS